MREQRVKPPRALTALSRLDVLEVERQVIHAARGRRDPVRHLSGLDDRLRLDGIVDLISAEMRSTCRASAVSSAAICRSPTKRKASIETSTRETRPTSRVAK